MMNFCLFGRKYPFPERVMPFSTKRAATHNLLKEVNFCCNVHYNSSGDRRWRNKKLFDFLWKLTKEKCLGLNWTGDFLWTQETGKIVPEKISFRQIFFRMLSRLLKGSFCFFLCYPVSTENFAVFPKQSSTQNAMVIKIEKKPAGNFWEEKSAFCVLASMTTSNMPRVDLKKKYCFKGSMFSSEPIKYAGFKWRNEWSEYKKVNLPFREIIFSGGGSIFVLKTFIWPMMDMFFIHRLEIRIRIIIMQIECSRSWKIHLQTELFLKICNPVLT